ncbi:MAG: sigma-70 family RNA polymerase sigma factor [Myxococcota bacterium]
MYRLHGPMVHRRCKKLLGDHDEAADAMHDVFVVVVRRQDRLTDKSPGGLLYKIATDVCLNRLRTRRRRPETRDELLLQRIASADQPERLTAQRSLLDRIFQREKPSTQLIAVLHYVDGMTLEETAKVVGMSVSGVRKRLRGLKANASHLQEALP